MTVKQVQKDVDKLNKMVVTLKNTVSDLKDELAVYQNEMHNFRRMVAADMKKLVDRV